MKNRLAGSFVATGNISNATTGYHRDPLSLLFGMCKGAVESNNRVFIHKDRLIRVNLNWVRDYVLSMKGFRYFEPDLVSFIDLILEEQTEKGFFFEIIAPLGTDMHSGKCVDNHPECRKIIPGSRFGLCRLELEADIEYLMVEGVFMIWQAVGNDDYLRRNLPRLEKGLNYIKTDPLRWDDTYNLAKRPHTIDTWDFLDNRRSQMDRTIHPDDPMGIMHGDNTGLYQAEILMAKMYRVVGDETAALQHDKFAVALKERINKYLWNGEFYRHFLCLDPVDYGVDEKWQLSLSNSYALNRGTATPEMCRAILNRYRSMRDKYHGPLDDFRTLDPAYPVFLGMKAGTYVNGTCGPFVAGELALGAFENGMEDYGVAILDRIGCKMLDDGKLGFLYNYEGNDAAGGPRCWGGAEMMHALTMGLAGVRDHGKLFEDVTFSPRFSAAHEPEAYVRLEYAPSQACAEYHWTADYAAKRLTFELVSTHQKAQLRMLLPKGACSFKASAPGFRLEKVFDSSYAVCDAISTGTKFVLDYAE